MIGIDISDGGRVEREIKIVAKTVIASELGEDIDDPDALAQVMCELYCKSLQLELYPHFKLGGAHMNRILGFPTIKVRGYLTDLKTFKFVEYDPSTDKFSRSIPLRLRPDAPVEETLVHFLASMYEGVCLSIGTDSPVQLRTRCFRYSSSHIKSVYSYAPVIADIVSM